MIDRLDALRAVHTALGRAPVCALLGPRQCGKTTLARQVAGAEARFFDLESAVDRSRLQNPESVLGAAEGLVVIDEIQRMPELFETLRVVVDAPGRKARFLILGSASPALMRRASESLAGRVEFVELGGFDLRELGGDALRTRWQRGGFPRAFLAATEADSVAWRRDFVRTFLERDIPQLGIQIPAETMRRAWTMLAHVHGQVWNASDLARSLGVTSKTVERYLDLLCGTFMVRRLPPWHANLRKRQVKSPKIYVRDSGVLHTLLELPNFDALAAHPKLGASWEGLLLELILRFGDVEAGYFWGTHTGAELDLLVWKEGRPVGIELKWTEAPKLTRSMHSALEDLELEHLLIIAPTRERYPIHERVTVVPAAALAAGQLSALLG